MADITIIIPSYNKEKYIAEALDSVFMQKTDYSYHVVIADDCSTDRTIEIAKQYQEKYPDKIEILTSDTNQKLYKNVLRAYAITKTDYFCVLDPDDKWTNPMHIQNALSFLEKHKDFTIYSTCIIKKYENGKEELMGDSKHASNSTFKDGLNLSSKIASTQSVVYRNVIFKYGIPEKMLNLECKSQEKSFRGDTFRNYVHLEKGKAHHEPDKDAVYNITGEGVYTSLAEMERYLLNANIFKDIWLYYDKKYAGLLALSKMCYLKIISNVLDNLTNMATVEKREELLCNLRELNQYYKDYQADIDNFYLNQAKFKTRFCYYVYKKIIKYLNRKGVV